MVALVASWLNERFLRWRSQLAVALAAALAIWVWRSGALAPGFDVSDRLAALESTWLAQAVLAPFAAFCNLARATDSRELALWGGGIAGGQWRGLCAGAVDGRQFSGSQPARQPAALRVFAAREARRRNPGHRRGEQAAAHVAAVPAVWAARVRSPGGKRSS